MSDDLNTGAEFYIYNDYTRKGIVDSEVGPGACDIVVDERVKNDDGSFSWKRLETVSCVDFNELRALAKAADLMEAWEGGKPIPRRDHRQDRGER